MNIRRSCGSKMLILITYDVNTEDSQGKKRLRHVAKCCVNYGVRVQNSVFECIVDSAQWRVLKQKLIDEIDAGVDSLRFYYLGDPQKAKIEHYGAKSAPEMGKPLLL